AVALLQLPLGIEENVVGHGDTTATPSERSGSTPPADPSPLPSPSAAWEEAYCGGTTPTAEVECSWGERRRCFKGVLHVCARGVLFEPRDKALPVMRLWYRRMTRFSPWETTEDEERLLEACGVAGRLAMEAVVMPTLISSSPLSHHAPRN
ncbi:hypothetical protein T484DRAFT_1869160, partial [Baffinella frigidus]